MTSYPVNTAKNTKAIIKELLGQELGVTSGGIVVGENFNGYALRNQKYYSNADVYGKSGQYDDFLGAAVSSLWTAKTGSDGGVITPTINAQENGVVRMVTGAGATLTMAVNGVSISGSLNYLANKDRLVAETLVKLQRITTISYFFGFTNQVSALQMPINSAGSANTVTNNAADAVGILFDSSMTTQNFFGVGVKSSTGTTPLNLGVAPVAATFVKLRVEVDVAGTASFYVNDIWVGGAQVANTVTITAPLAPVSAGFSRSALACNIEHDYFWIQKNRQLAQ